MNEEQNSIEDIYAHVKATISMLRSLNLMNAKKLNKDYESLIQKEKDDTKNFILMNFDMLLIENSKYCQRIDRL